jgi:hypothetical protein
MKLFKDKEGMEWTIDVSVDALMRVRELAKVDLLDLENSCYLMAEDKILQAEVLWAICKPQADQRNLSSTDFYRRLNAEALEAAAAAVPEEVLSFFPKPRREAVRRAMVKKTELEETGGRLAIDKIDRMDVQKILRDALGASSTSSPASAGSTPAP